MAKSKRRPGDEREKLKKAQQIIYGRDFKRADRAKEK